ncbi:MAG TPA: hypothetical protein VF306_22745 [Pirellulales bacterium]
MSSSDLNDLRLLSRLHDGLAVLTALFPLVTLPILGAGLQLLSAPAAVSRPAVAAADDAEARVWRSVLGKLAVGGVAAIAAVCLVHAGVLWYIGRQIAACRRRWLVMIFSALHLVNVPLGTALSMLTFTVLNRQNR